MAIVDMPRDGATIFSDLIGKLDVLRVSCDKCGRDGCYGLHRLIEKRGRDAKLIDWPPFSTANYLVMNVVASQSEPPTILAANTAQHMPKPIINRGDLTIRVTPCSP